MEPVDEEDPGAVPTFDQPDDRSAVNALILDYYKKFGRKRDLEQFFSLSTAQGDIRDPSGLFWRRMKAMNSSSDSGDKPSESSTELCRISIKCSIPEQSSSQDEKSKPKSDTESPPIITEESPAPFRHSDDESVKSEDNHSQKSCDVTLDTSTNKPLSPTSSVTSQRKLEWDSLADVGYANESDRKPSSSSLSTLERLAILQQYSNSDKEHTNIGPPTAHSTFLDSKSNESCKSKSNKKNFLKNIKEIHNKDIVEVNVPHTSNSPPKSISVNLTKHISFNVEKDGAITVVDSKDKQLTVKSPDKISKLSEIPEVRFDKEIQTSLPKSNSGGSHSRQSSKSRYGSQMYGGQAPVLISLNSLKRRIKRRKTRTARKRSNTRKTSNLKKEIPTVPVHEKSGEQVSEAESFEYMPGHIYNQNQMIDDHQKTRNSAGNKSSLESSGGVTTGSSMAQNSFTRDLERSIKLLNTVLQRHNDDSNLKKKLVKDVVQKLLKTRYRDDESTTDFLSGLSFSSKRLGLDPRDSKNYTTTSTSDTNNSTEKSTRPKKSILRIDKFNANAIASTSQSAPNLPLVSNSEKPVTSSLNPALATSHTESDMSSKGKDSSDTPFLKTSSEELYQKYKEAVKREEAYKRHLRDKEKFLKQKLVGSDGALKTTALPQPNKQSNRLKELMNDLARNNYDDGSGDASKLEGGSITSNKPIDKIIDTGKLRSHSVFTLSSENSDRKNAAIERENRKINLRKRLQDEIAGSIKDQGTSKECHCGCGSPQATNQCCVTDSSVQIDICGRRHSSSSNDNSILKSNRTQTKEAIDSTKQQEQKEDASSEIKYVCLCTSKRGLPPTAPENFMLYKCSRMTNHCLQTVKNPSKTSNNVSVQCYGGICSSSASSPRSLGCSSKDREIIDIYPGKHLRVGEHVTRMSQTSQTNIQLNISGRRPERRERSLGSNSTDSRRSNRLTPRYESEPGVPEYSEKTQISNLIIHEITRSIQTEMSINPRIPDASLSDIRIISDRECVKVISENYREVSRQTIQECEKKLQGRKNSDTQMYAASVGSFGLTPRAFDSQEDLSSQPTELKKQNVGVQSTKTGHVSVDLQDVARQDENTESYTIPLQGTNMTLKVSIGSKKPQPIPVIKKNVSHISLSQGSDQSDELECEEKGTSMPQEYSQAVRSPRADVFYNLLNTGEENIASSRVINRIQHTQITMNRQKYLDNASGVETPKYGTYPAVERKPFLRTYTDAGILEKKLYDEYRSLKDQDTYKNCCAHSGTGANQAQITVDKKKYTVDSDREMQTSKYGSCPTKERKPFLRMNTDVGILENDESRKKSDSIKLQDANTQSDLVGPMTKTNQTNTNEPPPVSEKCTNQKENTNSINKNEAIRSTKPGGDTCASCNAKNTERNTSLEGKPFRPIEKSTKPGDDTCGSCNPNNTERNTSIEGKRFRPIEKSTKPGDDTCGSCNPKNTERNTSLEGKPFRPIEKSTKPGDDTCGSCNPNNTERNTSLEGKPFRPSEKPTKPGEDTNCGSCNPKITEPSISLEGNPFSSTEKNTKPGDDTCASCTCNANKDNNKEPKALLKSDNTFGGSCKKQNMESREINKSEKRNDSCKICNAGAELARSSSNKHDSDAKKDERKRNYSENNSFIVNSASTKEGGPLSFVGKSTNPGDDTCASCSTNKDKKIEPNITSLETDDNFGCCNKKNTESRELKKSEKRNDTRKTCNADAGPYHSSYNKDDCCAKNDERKRKYNEDNNSTDDSASTKDPILEAIRNITSRYSKKDLEKGKKKKCFKEIMTVLNYLLDTDVTDDTDQDVKQCTSCSESANKQNKSVKIDEVKKPNANKKDKPCAPFPSKIKQTTDTGTCFSPKKLIDKAIQLSQKRSRQKKLCCSESSDLPTSSDIHETSTDRDCKILSQIKKECEKYHQKRCKSCYHDKKCESSSCTSVECDECKKTHHCHCRSVHKCKGYRPKVTCERVKKKCVAYNLIIQTSDSLVSEENANEKNNKHLQDIIVKVPSRRNNCIPETVKIRECKPRPPSPCRATNRSRSLPNESEISSTDDYKRAQSLTVKEYLEKNRPDFIEKTSDRINCLKMISESRANQRAAKRELLSLQLQRSTALNTISSHDLLRLAKELGYEIRRKRLAPKFISERDMKQHSERIYKSLPEVQQKKEDVRKENVKKTNLLMASMFKKSLQKKTLRGTVNLSNYSPVIKI